MQAASSNQIVERAIRAARLDRPVYEEVERDQTATTQAAIIVGIAALAAGIGALGDGAGGLFGGIIGAVLGWLVSAVFIFFVATRLIPSSGTSTTVGEVLRTTGFANAPGVLQVVGFIPVLGPLVAFVAGIWVLVATVIALMAALEMSALRAIATALIAGLLAGIVGLIIAAIFGGAAWGLGALF